MMGRLLEAGSASIWEDAPRSAHYHAFAAGHARKIACLKIPSDAMAILLVSPAVMPLQIFFFAQDLTVDQPRGRNEINQADPIWKYQKFANQDHRKRDIDGIAAKGENAIHDEFLSAR
jgi:hypothetical protein